VTPGKIHVTGYDGTTSKVDQIGRVDGLGTAALVPKAPNNLVNLKKLCHEINGRYEGDDKQITIYDGHGRVYVTGRDVGDGFLSFAYGDVRHYDGIHANAAGVSAEEARRPHFTPEEIARAREAYQLCALHGHPGDRSLMASLRNHNILDCNLELQDLINARKLYGPCEGCTEAKIIAPRAPPSQTPPARNIGDKVFLDITFFPEDKVAIGGFRGTLNAVDEKSAKFSVSGFKSKNLNDIFDAAKVIVDIYTQERHDIKLFVCDDEKVLNALKTKMAPLGIRVETTAAGLHNKRCERYIRTFKERLNAMRMLPYELPGELEMELHIAAARSMNSNACKQAGGKTPDMIFSGRRSRTPRYAFGQVGICHGPRDDMPNQRGEWCIFLYHRDRFEQSPTNLRVYIPHRRTVVSRRRFEPMNSIPAEWGYRPRIRQLGLPRGRRPQPPSVPLVPPRMQLEFAPTAAAPPGVAAAPPAAPPVPAPAPAGTTAAPPDRVEAPQGHDVDEHVALAPPRSAPGQASEGAAAAPAPLPLPPRVAQAPAASSNQEGVPRPLPAGPPVAAPPPPREAPASEDLGASRSLGGAPPPRQPPTPVKPAARPPRQPPPQKIAPAPPVEPPKPSPSSPEAAGSGRPRRAAAQFSYRDGPARDRKYEMNSASVILEDTGEVVSHPFLHAYRISLGEAFKEEEKREMTVEATRDEFKGLLFDMKALKPVHFAEIADEDRKNILNGHIFYKDKYTARGDFERRKGRFVMNGNEQDPFHIDETRAPTVNPITLMSVLACSATRKTKDKCYDVLKAFVGTPMKKGKHIYARVGKKLTPLLVELFPFLSQYVHTDGCLYMLLLSYMYGLAEAAREFFLRLKAILESLGFQQAQADECLFIRDVNGERHYLCVHVDDIYSSAPTDDACAQFERELQKRLDVKMQEGSLSYLGMVIDKDKHGTIRVNQCGYTQAILDRFNVSERPVQTPAYPGLLTDAAPVESKPAEGTPRDRLRKAIAKKKQERQKGSKPTPRNAREVCFTAAAPDDTPCVERSEFISIVMSLMYLARYTRPDILMVVTYLATKCQAPTRRDYLAARWVLRYIKGTKDKGLTFKNSDLRLEFYADASHLLHSDGYGHSGMLATLGGTIIFARSVKQKLVARSSSEAELISADDCATFVVWLRQLCADLGIKVSGPTPFAQDNKSAIIIMLKGGTFKRTKHMIGKMAYLRERIKMGDIHLHYVPTEDMLADMLTKPVSRETLRRHGSRFGFTSQRQQK
jgi:hypothetical protein